MNRLYPLKFKPIIKDKIWGGTRLKNLLNKSTKTDKAGESWEISGFPGNISRVKNGFLAGNSLEEIIEVYMGDLVGDSVFDQFGTMFPLLIKFIDANDVLSVQVHPGDELAEKQFGSFGKTEMWYVLSAEKDAEIIIGFNQKVDAEKYMDQLEKKKILDILNKEKTRPGDVFFLPAGRIHALGSGILVAEIQQTSDATLRIYDFDRVDEKGKPRPLHNDKALEAIDFSDVKEFKTSYKVTPNESVSLVSCNYFTTNLIELSKSVDKDYSRIDSFIIFMCIEGSFSIRYYDNELEQVKKGETVLLPAELKNISLLPDPSARILEIYAGKHQKPDRSNELFDQILG
ncbi:MAG TPA: type I phosphomannose isomerase catalytic subunit [Bacteroidales bacterium]|nr:type I phosphomannose isomerase catalytic subunit [Bacteroidales bacterium]